MKKASVGKAGVFGFHLVGICAFFAPDENSYAMFCNELNDHKTIFSDMFPVSTPETN